MSTENIELIGNLLEYGLLGVLLALSLRFNFLQYKENNQARDSKEAEIARLNDKFQDELLSYLEKQLASNSATREAMLKFSTDSDKNKTDLIIEISKLLKIENNEIKQLLSQFKNNRNV